MTHTSKPSEPANHEYTRQKPKSSKALNRVQGPKILEGFKTFSFKTFSFVELISPRTGVFCARQGPNHV